MFGVSSALPGPGPSGSGGSKRLTGSSPPLRHQPLALARSRRRGALRQPCNRLRRPKGALRGVGLLRRDRVHAGAGAGPTAARSRSAATCAHHQGMGLNAPANVLMENSLPRRFHAHPLIRAGELLLQEKVPDGPPIIMPHEDETEVVHVAPASVEIVARRMGAGTRSGRGSHLLSNGRYSVMVTDTGGGSSTMGDVAVTRFRPDNTRDQWGQFLYLRDLATNRVWSPTYQPTCAVPDAYEITYAIDKAEFRRLDGNWRPLRGDGLSGEPGRSPSAPAREPRLEERVIEVTSYAEIALCPPAADLAHPAFQKLFVETEYVPGETALIARRRPRDAKQPPLFGVHVLSMRGCPRPGCPVRDEPGDLPGPGLHSPPPRRLSIPARPQRHRRDGSRSDLLAPVQGPVPAESSVVVAFTTGVADSRDEAAPASPTSTTTSAACSGPLSSRGPTTRSTCIISR